jgi:hypothetical protein
MVGNSHFILFLFLFSLILPRGRRQSLQDRNPKRFIRSNCRPHAEYIKNDLHLKNKFLIKKKKNLREDNRRKKKKEGNIDQKYVTI